MGDIVYSTTSLRSTTFTTSIIKTECFSNRRCTSEEFCLRREVEKKIRKEPGTYLLLGISPCIGIGSTLEHARSDLGRLNVKVGRMGDTGDRR